MIKAVPVMSILLFALQTAAPGEAQSTSRTPLFRGLFGPTDTDQTRPRRLDATWSLYSAEDDNSFLATDTDILDAALQSRRWYSGATISLAYMRRPPRTVFKLNVSAATRYYPDLHRVVTTRQSGGVSVDHYLASDWRLHVSGDAGFTPFYQVLLSPSAPGLSSPDIVTPAADYAVSKQHAMLYGSFVGLTHTYSDRADLAFNYGLRYTQLSGSPDVSTQRGGGQFTYLLNRGIGLRLGYAYGVATTGSTASAIRNNDIDVGLNYGRTFSPSARTSFSFGSGSSIISSGDGRHFRVTGSGRLRRRLSPRWTTDLTYDRGLQVPEGATRPFFSDSMTGSLNGYFSKRISLHAQPTYSHGVVGFQGKTNAYNSWASTTRIDVALSRQVALYAEHFYYRYQFANGVDLPSLLIMGTTRQGARAGLTVWTPLVR